MLAPLSSLLGKYTTHWPSGSRCWHIGYQQSRRMHLHSVYRSVVLLQAWRAVGQAARCGCGEGTPAGAHAGDRRKGAGLRQHVACSHQRRACAADAAGTLLRTPSVACTDRSALHRREQAASPSILEAVELLLVHSCMRLSKRVAHTHQHCAVRSCRQASPLCENQTGCGRSSHE